MVWVSAGSRIGFGRETSFGSQQTITRFLGITNQSIELPDKTVDVKTYNSFGQGRKRFLVMAGRNERNGSLPLIPTTAELFYYLFGADTFTGGSPNKHVLAPASVVSLPSMTLGVALEGTPNFLRSYVGTIIDGADVSLSEGGELQASFDLFAKDVLDEQTGSPALFTQPSGSGQAPYMFYHANANVNLMGVYDYAADTGITGGKEIASIKSFNWSLRNNAKKHWYFNGAASRDPALFTTSQPDFSLSLQLMPSGKLSGDTDAVYHLLEASTQGDILLPFFRSANDRIDVVFEDAILRSAPHPLDESGGEVVVNCTVEAEEVRVVVRDSIGQYSTL